ncbi:MAG: DsrE family protein [Burkholderiales bacterium]|nr:DsrE family protein [Burkholderiales bacterium]
MKTSNRRFLGQLGTVALAGALIPGLAAAQTPSKAKKDRVVFQMSDNDPGKWALALNNMRNVQVELGEEDVDVELVAFGPGIAMLKGGSPMAQRITEALKTGAKVVACENTMKAQKLVYADMLPDIGYVPAGVVELMRKQQQGWAYIKP